MKVVLVDDHAIVRDGLRLLVSGEDDIEVVDEAADGAAALEILEETHADVVLLDLRMEGMGGFATLEALARSHPEVRVIVLTMHDDVNLLRRAVELGARGYVLKGSSSETLLGALRAVASGGSYVDPRLTDDLVTIALDPQPSLSDEDLQILRLLADGAPNHVVAERLAITPAQLRSRLRDLYAALEVSGRSEAVASALRRGLIE